MKQKDTIILELSDLRKENQDRKKQGFKSIAEFLEYNKQYAKRFSVLMNRLELSQWDGNHEKELKNYFGYTDRSLLKRKNDLIAASK